jgi:transposase
MSESVLQASPKHHVVRKRTRRDPNPRFKPDTVDQLDVLLGSPSAQVGDDHLARKVQSLVAELDVTSLEEKYSSLGRHGFHPRNVLAVWIYASMVGLHHGTKLSRAMKTDAALRFLSGGHSISRSRLNEFRSQNGAFLQQAIEQTVSMAEKRGLLKTDELAVDSMRLRANASTKATRTLARSTKRLAELKAVDVKKLSKAARAEHAAKVKKHESAIAECTQQDRPSIVTTNPLASLMKFPSGAGLPGHRLTVTAAGVKQRLVVGLLLDSSPTDDGLLQPAVEEARRVLATAGITEITNGPFQVAADAGYDGHQDLLYAEGARPNIDLLVNCGEHDGTNGTLYGRERFRILQNRTAICPAGKKMQGPSPHHSGRLVWTGIGCADCEQKPLCTTGKKRSLTADLELDRARASMRARLAAPGGRKRYNQRIATVEPVFSSIQDVMGFRRASSRVARTVIAEVLLKVLAHNLGRLIAARTLAATFWLLGTDGSVLQLSGAETELRATL